MHRRDLHPWLPLLILALAVGVLFYRILIGEVLFWGLPSLQFYPWRWFAFEELSEGRLPFWNPYNGAGSPLVANYQSAILYPPNWLYVLDVPQMMGIIALLHVLWSGWGMWKFTSELEFSTFSRGVALLCYALGGYTIGRLGSFPTANAAAWLPWLFWGVLRALQYQQMRDIGFLALITGLMLLAGHAQTSWYAFVAVGLFALWHSVAVLRGQRRRLQGLVLAVIGIVLGAGIAFWQLAMTLEYLQQSQRSGGVSYKELTNFSYAPLRALTMVMPHLFGTPADGSYLTPDTGVYFEDAAYIGFIPLVAVGFAITGWLKWRKFLVAHSAFRSVPFWVILSAAGFVLALGYYGPFYQFLYQYVPTFDNFREPVRWLLWPAFGLSILAGIGVQNWGRNQRAFFWSRLGVAGGIGCVVMALLVSRNIENVDAKVIEVLVRALVAFGCWIVVGSILTLMQPAPTPNTSAGYWQLTVLLVIVADLAWASAGLNPTVPNIFYGRDLSMSHPQGRLYWYEDYEREVKFGRYFDLGDYRRARDRWSEVRTSLLPNLNILNRIHLFNNFDPLQPRVHRQYVELIENSGENVDALLRAAAVGQVYGPIQPKGWDAGQQANTWVAPSAPPRVWLVPAMYWAENDEAAIESLTSTAWNPQQLVILQGRTEPPTPIGTSFTVGSVVTISERPTRRQYQISSDGPSYLVMASTWYPGWSVKVDGEDATLYRANLAFQAVYIPDGDADVVVSYTPQRSGITIIVSIFSLLGALVLVAWGLFQEPIR